MNQLKQDELIRLIIVEDYCVFYSRKLEKSMLVFAKVIESDLWLLYMDSTDDTVPNNIDKNYVHTVDLYIS